MPIPSDWPDQVKRALIACDLGSTSLYTLQRDDEGEYLSWLNKFVLTEEATDWEDVISWLTELGSGWLFRGQSNSSWGLRTSFDRAIGLGLPTEAHHVDLRPELARLTWRFQQQARQYLHDLPELDDHASWLCLMQHHGVPTILLDWTLSPYAGIYFACAGKPDERGASLWAINEAWITAHSNRALDSAVPLIHQPNQPNSVRFPERGGTFGGAADVAARINLALAEPGFPQILRVDPQQLPARMAAQQGLFLCNLAIGLNFDAALLFVLGSAGYSLLERPVVRKLVMPQRLRWSVLRNLRTMNIHAGSLFPGLDGFAQSLRADLELSVAGLD